MKAQVIASHGTVENLTYHTDWPRPAATPGHVVIQVGACALNYHDLFTLKGMPGIKVPMPLIMGIDVAGTVAEVGPGCGDWQVGDRVLATPTPETTTRSWAKPPTAGSLNTAACQPTNSCGCRRA